MTATNLVLGLEAAIIAVTDYVPRILIVDEGNTNNLQCINKKQVRLPFGFLNPETDTTLEKALRSLVITQTGLQLPYVEQLYTFGDQNRFPKEKPEDPRVISAAYLALAQENNQTAAKKAKWQDIYHFLPWEDWRNGAPKIINQYILPALNTWANQQTPKSNQSDLFDRIDICFGSRGVQWDPEKSLERYELLYEATLVAESQQQDKKQQTTGQLMALDHRRILATALGRLRGKIKYRPVIFELLEPHFTLLNLQQVVEALAGSKLHKQNFRRLVEKQGLVERTGLIEVSSSGRPAELFRFRREVFRERQSSGVSFPGAKWTV